MQGKWFVLQVLVCKHVLKKFYWSTLVTWDLSCIINQLDRWRKSIMCALKYIHLNPTFDMNNNNVLKYDNIWSWNHIPCKHSLFQKDHLGENILKVMLFYLVSIVLSLRTYFLEILFDQWYILSNCLFAFYRAQFPVYHIHTQYQRINADT